MTFLLAGLLCCCIDGLVWTRDNGKQQHVLVVHNRDVQETKKKDSECYRTK